MKTFSFKEASPLLEFIEKYRGQIIGKTIKKFYSTDYYGELTPSPIAFSLDGFDLILCYLIYSDLTLWVAKEGAVEKDRQLRMIYPNDPIGHRSFLNEDEEFPYSGQKIADIEIERFSSAFEINPCTEEMRPEGGDYFKKITIHLESGKKFYLCAAPTAYDGYFSVWDDETDI